MYVSRFLSIMVLLLTISCVPARDPSPVAVQQSEDGVLTCEQITAEYRANTASAASKIEQNRSDDGKDVMLGAFVWPGLIDLKNADGTEGNALLDRNRYLTQLAVQRNCNTVDWPEQPERYQ